MLFVKLDIRSVVQSSRRIDQFQVLYRRRVGSVVCCIEKEGSASALYFIVGGVGHCGLQYCSRGRAGAGPRATQRSLSLAQSTIGSWCQAFKTFKHPLTTSGGRSALKYVRPASECVQPILKCAILPSVGLIRC